MKRHATPGHVVIEDAKCTAETDLAIRVQLGDGPTTRWLWVPKSLVHDDSEVYDLNHAEGTLVVPEWFALDKGLI